MSLINQMLKDLEARRKKEEKPLRPAISAVEAADKKPHRRWLLVLVVILLITAVPVAQRYFGEKKDNSAEVTAIGAVQPAPAVETAPEEKKGRVKTASLQPVETQLLGWQLLPHPQGERIVFEFDQQPVFTISHPAPDQTAIILEQSTFSFSQIAVPHSARLLHDIRFEDREGISEIFLFTSGDVFSKAFVLESGFQQGYRLIVELATPGGRTEPDVATVPPAAPSTAGIPVAEEQTVAKEEKTISENPKTEVPIVEKTARNSRKKVPLTKMEQAELAWQKAVKAWQMGDSAATRIALRNCLQLQPDHLKASELQVSLALRSGQRGKVIALLQGAIEKWPEHAKFRTSYATLLAAQGENEQARKVLDDTLPAAASNADYIALTAELEQRLGRNENAVRQYTKALRLRSGEGRWWSGLGIALEQLGEPQRALMAYRQALRDNRLAQKLKQFVQERSRELRTTRE